jgi:excisionase family DNA binding protein
MRNKYSPLTASCLIRLQAMIDSREAHSDAFPVWDGERILTPGEVAYVLDTSTTTVASLVKSGRLTGHNFGKVSRFLERDVLEFIGVAHEGV